MNKKLLIALGVLAAILVVLYFVSQPKEAVAPVEEPVTNTENNSTEESTTTSSDTEVADAVTPATTASTKSVSPKPSTATTQESPAAPSLPYTAVVVYNGERFIPDKVTVILGGTVRFVNTSDEKMWIASDNHPTHTRYPIKTPNDCAGSSFDQCEEVGEGGSWSFTFTRTGTWGYHNHLRAQDTGDVVVRTEEEYLKSI